MPALESDEDGDAARDWDRQRFLRLLIANWPDRDNAAPMDAIAAMSEPDRAEALELLDRLGDPFEDPETTRARQRILTDYALMEIKLLETIGNPSPQVNLDTGELVRGADGEPLPDEKIRRQARTLLHRVQRDRARMLGED